MDDTDRSSSSTVIPHQIGGRRRKYSNKTLLGVVFIKRYIDGVRATAGV